MGLLKWFRGNKQNLPNKSQEGSMYLTEDTGDLYLFKNENTRVQLNANLSNALRNPDTNSNISVGDSNTPVYFYNGVPVVCAQNARVLAYDAEIEVSSWGANLTATISIPEVTVSGNTKVQVLYPVGDSLSMATSCQLEPQEIVTDGQIQIKAKTKPAATISVCIILII